MPICANCGQENPEGFRLCGMCGAPLAAAERAEERKIVSVLFVDLVGHTARSAEADPEDVRAALERYHVHVKREIERFGGTVEKFVGDAVMAVFGAPVAHEDDAERAVRAGLRIVDELGEQVRAAVNTGEALVAIGARAETGEALVAGDVVNTAARLQGVAPPGALVAGELTMRATRDAIDYEQLEPVELKGKPDPVPLWRARGARSRFGVDVEQPAAAPLIGREDELALLKQLYARVVREPGVQLVTVAGEPGVGKSRLVSEFRQWLDDEPDLVYWRQGRCLSYGEGITFWALGEVVKAQAGILESESPAAAEEKLRRAVEAVPLEPSEREWARARLAPLVGVTEAAGAADRSEAFTAWLRFLEGVASVRPLVLVFEDLHWADEAMLEFVDHAVEWSSGVPLLVLCTARPELFERHGQWSGGKRNATTISLSPLSDDETARLVAVLLDRAVLPAETQQMLLERAGGNPLYAEQFVRMLADRGGAAGDIPLPDTVQAVVAARLDTLPPERKALLQDAAVVGKVFWNGALTSMGGRDDGEVRDSLHQLVRKELVRPARRSSVEGEAEFSFWHLLVRDVAYAQIPRAARAAKHRAAAEWIEEIAGARVEDHAELLAHHYDEALALARAAGRDEEAAALAPPAARFVELAGDRALHLDAGKASAYYEHALELLAEDDADQARVLLKAGRSAAALGRDHDASRYFERAIAAAEPTGDVRLVGAAKGGLSLALWARGETARGLALLDESRALLEQGGASSELATAYGRSAFQAGVRGHHEQALQLAEKGLAIASELGDEERRCNILSYRGIARGALGDRGGLEDLREGVRLGVDNGFGRPTVVAYNNLGWWLWLYEGPAPALEVQRAGIEYAQRRGMRAWWNVAETAWTLYDLGRWDELLRVADEVLEAEREQGRTQMSAIVTPMQAAVLARRGRLAEAAALAEEFLPAAREIGDIQVLAPAVDTAAMIASASGETAGASTLLDELPSGGRFYGLADESRILAAAGALERAAALVEERPIPVTRVHHNLASARAILAEAAGDLEAAAGLFDDAARRWVSYGHVLEHAFALLGRGRCAGTAADVREARRIFADLGAVPLVAEADALLSEQAAAS